MLILPSFVKASASLEEALDLPEDPVVRDAAIQRFERAYELAWKSIARRLGQFGVSDVESLSCRALFREAAKVGLLHDAELWFDFQEARNLASRAYDEQNAEEVFAAAKSFAVEARRLLAELKRDR